MMWSTKRPGTLRQFGPPCGDEGSVRRGPRAVRRQPCAAVTPVGSPAGGQVSKHGDVASKRLCTLRWSCGAAVAPVGTPAGGQELYLRGAADGAVARGGPGLRGDLELDFIGAPVGPRSSAGTTPEGAPVGPRPSDGTTPSEARARRSSSWRERPPKLDTRRGDEQPLEPKWRQVGLLFALKCVPSLGGLCNVMSYQRQATTKL